MVDRRYRVLSRVGSGGMGLVYKVEHIQLGKIAAMKVLHADTAHDSEAVRRFRTEAQAVSRLDHPNIVQTFDFGQSEGSLYLVMEYLKGDDLATVVKRDGPLPFDTAAPLFVQICSALTEAHDAGVIHRDLKPENIVVVARREGSLHAKVLDFGLAKLRERADGAEVTSGGQVIGTPYYMSPEQVRSEPLDVRTDIYSLGATLYRVLTGTPPFQATTPVGVLTKHITDVLEPPRMRAPELNLPAAADAIVTKAMAKLREHRYSTATEVQRDLEEAIRHGRALSAGVESPEMGDTLAAARLALSNRATANAPTVAVPSERILFGGAVGRVGDPASGVPVSASGDDGRAATESDRAGEVASDSDTDGERLRRQEFDAFERSLRRRKIVASGVLPVLLLAALVGLGIWAVARGREKAGTVEREPNDTPAAATLLPLDTPVQGKVGKRLGDGHPDLDYFRVPSGKGWRVVSARLEGIPNVDLVLELFDAQGSPIGKSDARGPGGGEWLQPMAIGPGEAYLLVRQVWIQGTPPVEDVPDAYRLAAHWGPPVPGWEVEPNDLPERATPVVLGQPLRGYLSSADDKDYFSVNPIADGRLIGRITPPGGVDLILTVDDGSPARRAQPKKAPPKPNEVDVPAIAGRRIVVGISRKPPTGGDPKSWGLAGLDDSYEVRLELRQAP